MTEQYIVWALIVGVVIGAALYWFAVGRLPRRTDDLSPAERVTEAGWISRTIESRGGVAPVDLVDEVLDLHADYLQGPPFETDEMPITIRPGAVAAAPTTQQRDEPRGS